MKISKKTFALIIVLTMFIASFSVIGVSAEEVDTSTSETTTVGAYVDTVTTTTSASIDDTIEGVVGGVVESLDLPDLSGSTTGFIDMIKSFLDEIRNFFKSVSETILSAFGASSTVSSEQ